MIPISDTLTIQARHSFSIIHLQSAAQLANLAQTKEQSNHDDFDHELHRASVIGAVMLAVAATEATVNEFFTECADNPPSERLRESLSAEVRHDLTLLWNEGNLDRARTMDKYKKALVIAQAKPFSRGCAPFQDASLVIRLRNALVHSTYVDTLLWSDDNELKRDEQDLEKDLKGKFVMNPYTGPSNPFFPDHCLSAGCARWSIESMVAFCDSFFQRIDVKAPYESIRGKLRI